MAKEDPRLEWMGSEESEEVVGRWLRWVVWLRLLECIWGILRGPVGRRCKLDALGAIVVFKPSMYVVLL